MKLLLWAAGAAVTAVAALFALLYWRQEGLLFAPVALPADFTVDEPDVVETVIPVDGAALSALHLRLPDPRGVVFFLHGNAGNLQSWFVNTDFYRKANFDLFMIDYRGYGKSTGHIQSEAQLRADVAAAWAHIAPLYRGRRTVILGRSLGTALAAGLAADVQPDLTILVSPYWSMGEMQALHYAWVPRVLLRYPLETNRDVARIRTPILFLHGDRDGLIPLSQSERLMAVARAGQLHVVPGAAHGDLQDFDDYRRALAAGLAAIP
jgi:alpha-beta hydrolase superfamily lysophospholipase